MRLLWVYLVWFCPIFCINKTPGLMPPYALTNTPQHARPLIILDAGHGGSDEGAKICHLMEKRLTLTTALMVRNYLEEMGYRIILTRSKDVFIPLPRRASIANQTKAALFISIHYNSSPSLEAKGIEVFYYKGASLIREKQSKLLGKAVIEAMVRQTKAVSRGVKSGNFHVIRETAMPAILIEGGFMTNEEERSKIRDKTYQKKLATGIARGIDHYFKTSLQ